MEPYNDHLQLNHEVVFTQFDDARAVLLHLSTMYYYVLNESGILIWNQLRQGRTFSDIVAAMTNTYEVDEAEARECIVEFLNDLMVEKLVV